MHTMHAAYDGAHLEQLGEQDMEVVPDDCPSRLAEQSMDLL